MKIDFAAAAKVISEQDNILILCHDHPDGDTLGSGFALCRALTAMGKKARVECADKIPQKYSYMYEGLKKEEFIPEFIMCVDVADKKLLGAMEEKYGDKISLCIDHHGSNRLFAENTCLDFFSCGKCGKHLPCYQGAGSSIYKRDCRLHLYGTYYRYRMLPLRQCHRSDSYYCSRNDISRCRRRRNKQGNV